VGEKPTAPERYGWWKDPAAALVAVLGETPARPRFRGLALSEHQRMVWVSAVSDRHHCSLPANRQNQCHSYGRCKHNVGRKIHNTVPSYGFSLLSYSHARR